MDVNILNETRIEVLFQMCFVIMVQITKVVGVGCNNIAMQYNVEKAEILFIEMIN